MKYKRIVEMKSENHWEADDVIVIIPKRKNKKEWLKEDRKIRRRMKKLQKRLGL